MFDLKLKENTNYIINYINNYILIDRKNTEREREKVRIKKFFNAIIIYV